MLELEAAAESIPLLELGLEAAEEAVVEVEVEGEGEAMTAPAPEGDEADEGEAELDTEDAADEAEDEGD